MKGHEATTLCILGRQPALGIAELESLYGPRHILPIPNGALLDIEAGEINFKRLGGTIKVAKILTILPTANWGKVYNYLAENIPKHLEYVPEGAFTLGVSAYGLELNVKKLNADLLSLKKIIRVSGRSTRIVPNKTLALNSAQVLHNKLTRRGAWELLAIRDAGRTYLAQTFFVQDIDAYAARDQARPKRDSRVGMLPPKLAQIIINLGNPPSGATILDPFCGTGVILQEGLLMGYSVIGSDIDQRMVEYSKTNLDWLAAKYPSSVAVAPQLRRTGDIPSSKYDVLQADATGFKWPKKPDLVASELYLGRPLSRLPEPQKLNKIVQDVNTITKKFLSNIAAQIPGGTRLSLAVPAWRSNNQFIHLPTLDNLTSLGYNRVSFVHARSKDLLYFREDQIVARELVVLTKN